MQDSTKKALFELLQGIPSVKRHLNQYLNQPMDFKRMIKVSIVLLDNEDTLQVDDIRSICEEVGGEDYLYLIANPKFEVDFATAIKSAIDSAMHVINTYREITTNK